MTTIWNPERVLGLQRSSHHQNGWRCAGILSAETRNTAPSDTVQEGEPTTSPTRCSHPLRQADNNTIRRLLAEMAHEMPDQVDYNVLLHLARACLCTDASPEPHRGGHEAGVIYEWTEMMGKEACRIREGAGSNFTSDPGPESGTETEAAIAGPSSPQLDHPSDPPGRPRLKSVTASTISQRRRSSPHSLTTPSTPSSTSTHLTISTARNSAHHPYAPPSPPDSATLPPTGTASPTAFPFPQLPLYHPVPLSLAALSSGSYQTRREQAAAQTTTPDNATPPTPSAMGSFAAASESSAAGADTLASSTPQYATVPPAMHDRVPPPLATATTIATDASTISADSLGGGELRCAIMSMPPRVGGGADHSLRSRPPSVGLYSPMSLGSAPDASRRKQQRQAPFPRRHTRSIQDGGGGGCRRSRHGSPVVAPSGAAREEDAAMRQEMQGCASEMSAIRAELAAMRAEMMQVLQQQQQQQRREARNDEELCRPASEHVPTANVSETLGRAVAATMPLLAACCTWILSVVVCALSSLKLHAAGEAASRFRGVLASIVSTAKSLFGAPEAECTGGQSHPETGRRGEGFQSGRALRRKASIGKMV
ncbi:hypothetical protein PpBr36_00891 [Pyricularia pennisetigena]|uniref:hypothetical protein n=1 Tax=Pyricularia pennisetigena TaxID=1578925 RepID=UPI00114D7377|nr:hypothetical protein PpBr36_00891 [Pyricularia pennisetigena]TLS27993.1 hypothetical protein PpBr36_00891 [Pyricularia pennisetigena]